MVQAIVADFPEPVMPSRVWKRFPVLDALGQCGYRRRLITGRLEIGVDTKWGHTLPVLRGPSDKDAGTPRADVSPASPACWDAEATFPQYVDLFG